MTALFSRLASNSRASSAAEFALVTPLLVLFMLGLVDAGRLLWTWNRAEKATEAGARYAAVTDMIPGGLASADFVTSTVIQGDPIPQSAFSGATCTSSGGTVSCSCTSGGTCPTLTPYNSYAFTNILTRMQRYMPELTAANVEVDYGYSGLGYAGTPAVNGPSIAPVISVSVKNVNFAPLTLAPFGTTVSLGTRSADMTVEDGMGNSSN